MKTLYLFVIIGLTNKEREVHTMESRKWLNVELLKEDYPQFRRFLKENSMTYEASSCAHLVHIKVYANRLEAEKCDNFLNNL